MNTETLEKFRLLLEQKKQDLLSSAAGSKESTQPVVLDQSSVGRLSRMDVMQVQAMALATARRNELELRKIHAALARIESGDYGLCVSCEKEIDIRRLEFDPASPRCITCASRDEVAG